MENRQRALALLVALLAIGAVAAVGTAAIVNDDTPDVDAETTNTTTTSDLVDGSTITYNASTNSTLSFNITNADGSNMKVKTLDNGTLLESFTNSSSDITFDGNFTDTSAFVKYYNLTLSDDEDGYTGVVADAGENVSLTYRMINDTSLASPGTTNVTIFWENDANKSFSRFEGDEVETADLGTLPSFVSSIPVVGANYTDGPAQATRSDIGVNGEDQDEITVHVADTDAQDALDTTHEQAGDAGLSWYGSAAVNGTEVPVVQSGEDGPDWLDTDEEAYVTVNDAGDEVVVHNAGDVLGSDQTTAELEIVGAEKAGGLYAMNLVSDYGGGALSQAGAVGAAVDANGNPNFGDA